MGAYPANRRIQMAKSAMTHLNVLFCTHPESTPKRLTKASLRDLTAEGQGAELADQARILDSIEDTIRLARDLARRAEAIKAAADLGEQSLAFTEMEMGVLCAIAYHQPIDRPGLRDIFGKEVSRDLLAQLRSKDLIASGPRSPRPGAPHTFVTTETFLVTFDLQSFRDLPELELSQT